MYTYTEQFLEVLHEPVYFNNSNSALEGHYTALQILKIEAKKDEKTLVWLRTNAGLYLNTSLSSCLKEYGKCHFFSSQELFTS